MDPPFASSGIAHVWTQGDAVTRSVALVLLVMSLATWVIILWKALDQRAHRRQGKTCEGFWHQDGRHTPQLHDQLDLSDWIERSLRNSLDDFTARAQSGLTVLASIASTAPFVGLFGTVWGIYHALLGISAAGTVGIDQVAGPIGEALIMTALGLLVAIPAVLGYNALVRGNKGIVHRLNRFANDLHAYFVTGARVTAGGNAKVLPLKRG